MQNSKKLSNILQISTVQNAVINLDTNGQIYELIIIDNEKNIETNPSEEENMKNPHPDTTTKKTKNNKKKVDKESTYRCEKCQKMFIKKYRYDAHILTEHERITNRPYACDKCDRSYKELSSLRYHQVIKHHPGKTNYSCDECGNDYKTEASLKYHRWVKHLGNARQKKVTCKKCDAAFFNSNELQIHNNAKHSLGKPKKNYKCQNCDKLFQTPYTLRYHYLRHHTEEKNCVCSICGARFARKFMLTSHMHNHGDKKFPCNYCNKHFQNKSIVDEHMKAVHLKIRPHICIYCGESFGSPKTLRHHTYIHTGEKPYSCNICGQNFRQLTAMKTHRNGHLKDMQEIDEITKSLQTAGSGCI